MWNDRLLSSQFPELCSFVKDKNISIQSVINTEDMTDLFHLPLSVQAFDHISNWIILCRISMFNLVMTSAKASRPLE
jgi:hypothetical protein